MKTFRYVGRTSSGTSVSGVSEANSQGEAIERLKQDDLIVGDIEEVSGAHDVDLRLGSRRAKEASLAIMCGQFATILQAGMPVVRTMQLVSGQTDDKTLRDMLKDVADDVAAGYGLADSFRKRGPGLPATFVETVRTGEASGELDTVFRRLGSYYAKSSRARSKAKSAMVYPCFVLAVAAVVIAIIMVFAVPTFKVTFEQMGVRLPWVTQLMIDSSDFWTTNLPFVVALVAAVAMALELARHRSEDFRLRWSRWGTKVPVIGRIAVMSAAGQYAGTMSVMMGAGLSVAGAVQVTSRTIANYWMANALAGTQADLEAGKPLSACLAKTGAFPALVTEMTGVGEQTGELERTLEVMGDYYDDEVESSTTRALSIMEPVLIVILAALVCGILLAVYLPIFTIYGGVSG